MHRFFRASKIFQVFPGTPERYLPYHVSVGINKLPCLSLKDWLICYATRAHTLLYSGSVTARKRVSGRAFDCHECTTNPSPSLPANPLIFTHTHTY